MTTEARGAMAAGRAATARQMTPAPRSSATAASS